MYWLNGKFDDQPQAVHIADRGFLLGDGAFETILVVNGAPAFLDEHIARLKNALEALSIDLEIGDLAKTIHELAARNGADKGEASARVTVTRGAGQRGLLFPDPAAASPTLLVTLHQMKALAGEPIDVLVSSHRRCETGISARHKTLNYLDNLLARNEAASAGCGEAVMVNGKGRVACASAANLFVVDEDGRAATPPVEEGALPGIVRAHLVHGGVEGVSICERPLELAELQDARLLLTNSLIGLREARLQGAETRPISEAQGMALKTMKSWYEALLNRNLKERADKR